MSGTRRSRASTNTPFHLVGHEPGVDYEYRAKMREAKKAHDVQKRDAYLSGRENDMAQLGGLGSLEAPPGAVVVNILRARI